MFCSFVPKIILFLFCFVASEQIFAQGYTQIVKGQVYDAFDFTPLPNALIAFHSDSVMIESTIADSAGYFTFSPKELATYHIRIYHTGYQPLVKKVTLRSGRESILKIGLVSAPFEMQEIVIRNERELGKTGTISIDFSEADRYPATFDDPARTAIAMAGASVTADLFNSIVLKGNSPLGIQWRINGIEVPNPNHFSSLGGTDGAVNMIHNDALDRAQLYTSAFPARYGNATSGVFDLDMRSGNEQKREHAMQVGLLGINASSEGPMGKKGKGSYLARYRYNTFEYLAFAYGDVNNKAPLPKYQDGQFYLKLPIRNQSLRMSIWGLGGNSFYSLREGSFLNTNEYTSIMTGLNIEKKINSRNLLVFQTLVYKQLYNLASEPYPTLSYSSVFLDLGSNSKVNENALRYQLIYKKRFNSRLTLQTGFVHSIRNNINMGLIKNRNIARTISRWSIENRFHTLQSFSEVEWFVSKRTQLGVGLHFFYLNSTNQASLDPRINIKHLLSPKIELSAAFGKHSKMEQPSIYGVNGNENLKLIQSLHALLGGTIYIGKTASFKTELFYQYLYNVPESSVYPYLSTLNSGNGIDFFGYTNRGEGYNRGIETMLDRRLQKGWYTSISASIFESKSKGRDGIWRSTRYDLGHTFGAMFGKDFEVNKKRKNVLSISSRFSWFGGQYYTPISVRESTLYNVEILDYSNIFNSRTPDYIRLDASAKYSTNYKKISIEYKLEVINVTNRLNVLRYFYNDITKTVDPSFMLPLVPVFSLNFLF